MRKTISTILITIGIFISVTSCSQTKSCETYRTGKFVLLDSQKSLEYTIERKDSIQTETNLKTGQISKYKIDWESDCKFSLTIIEGRQELLEFYKNKKLHIEIVEIYNDCLLMMR